MKKCFGYIRVSTIKQGEGVSLEAQRDAIEAYALRNDIFIARWFEEKETAAKKGRPIFNALVRSLLRREADGLVIHKIDRSARNFADWAKVGELSDAGIDVHFATESLDFRSRGGRLSADIQAVLAADYVRNLREETLKGIRGRLKQGLCPWGAPLGYLNQGKGRAKIPDPERAPHIQELFRLYATGAYSLKSLQTEMKRRGFRNSVGAAVGLSGIGTILANPFYCGIIKLRATGETYDGAHEALIGPSLFHSVQTIKLSKISRKNSRHDHLFRGLFTCALCGRAMIPEKQKGHTYYRCHSLDCATKAIREEVIEDAIARLLDRMRVPPARIAVASVKLV